MSDIDKIVYDLFMGRWVGESVTRSLDSMKNQLYKNLKDQINGYWSGSTAYSIMVDGGFLKDAKSNTKKQLTVLGDIFMKKMERHNHAD